MIGRFLDASRAADSGVVVAWAGAVTQHVCLMDIEEIKTLTNLMVDNDLSEIVIRDGEKRILLRRGSHGSNHAAHPVAHIHAHATPLASAALLAPAARLPDAAIDDGLARITSPMVGTFYPTPDPESPPFVKIGDRVGPETVVCIIEAMKVFNEIKAEVSGIVESIEVPSGAAVEFGQTLITLRVA